MPADPFTIAVPDSAIADLRERLARTRWPDEVIGAGWDYGVSLAFLRELCEHWRTRFDWRAQERRLNALHHFRAPVGGLRVHFVHERSRAPRPLPLLLVHGWPSTFWQMAPLIPLLVDPAAHGGDAADAFDVVVPSLPGCGFGDRPDRPGMSRTRIAELFGTLMTDVLGYRRFGVHAGDVGTSVATILGLDQPERVVGLHLTDVYYLAYVGPDSPPLSEAEERFMEEQRTFAGDEGGYDHLQRTKPQTAAYGLNDSPAGLAAWIAEKFRAWSDCGGELSRRFSNDELLTHVSIYWFTETINSSMRLYYERHHHPRPLGPGERVPPPAGFAIFPGDTDHPPREFAERSYHVTRFSEMPRGGHFAASEEPELLAREIREFFRPLRER
jgi:pimeloyl-ACP methyl ester carboxylesterase